MNIADALYTGQTAREEWSDSELPEGLSLYPGYHAVLSAAPCDGAPDPGAAASRGALREILAVMCPHSHTFAGGLGAESQNLRILDPRYSLIDTPALPLEDCQRVLRSFVTCVDYADQLNDVTKKVWQRYSFASRCSHTQVARVTFVGYEPSVCVGRMISSVGEWAESLISKLEDLDTDSYVGGATFDFLERYVRITGSRSD
jgi:hypothetical protein